MRGVGGHGKKRGQFVLAADGASPCATVAGDVEIDRVANMDFQDGPCWNKEAVQSAAFVDASYVLLSSSPDWDAALVMLSACVNVPIVLDP